VYRWCVWNMRKESESDVDLAKKRLQVAVDLIDPPPTVMEKAVHPQAANLREAVLKRVGGDPWEAVAAAFGLGFLMGAFPTLRKSKASRGILGRLVKL